MKMIIKTIYLCLIILMPIPSFAGNYEVYGRVSMYVDVTNNNARSWAAVMKIGRIDNPGTVRGEYIKCFPANKALWANLLANYDYANLINLAQTDGQDDTYIDNSPDSAGYSAALLQMLNHTHKMAKYLQDLGHNVRIYYEGINPIDYLDRANDIPVGVRISTADYDTARINKSANNLQILECSINQITSLSAPILTHPATDPCTSISQITWSQVSEATKYNMQACSDSNFSICWNYNDITSTSQPVSGFTYNTNYYARVQAINNVGMSLWSDAITFKNSICLKYFRLRFTDGCWYDITRIYEIKLYTEPNQTGTEFASQATATASSSYGINYPSKAIDNNIYSYWKPTACINQWFKLEFPTPKLPKSLSIYTLGNQGGLMFPKSFVFEGSSTTDFENPIILGTYSVANFNNFIWLHYNLTYP